MADDLLDALDARASEVVQQLTPRGADDFLSRTAQSSYAERRSRSRSGSRSGSVGPEGLGGLPVSNPVRGEVSTLEEQVQWLEAQLAQARDTQAHAAQGETPAPVWEALGPSWMLAFQA